MNEMWFFERFSQLINKIPMAKLLRRKDRHRMNFFPYSFDAISAVSKEIHANEYVERCFFNNEREILSWMYRSTGFRWTYQFILLESLVMANTKLTPDSNW